MKKIYLKLLFNKKKKHKTNILDLFRIFLIRLEQEE